MTRADERAYYQFIEEYRAETARQWTASYDEIADVIGARRAAIAAARRGNERRWFCEVNECTELFVDEPPAPYCPVHCDKQMHELVQHPGGAR